MKKATPSEGKRIPVIPRFVYLLFLLLALILVLVLDTINRDNGGTSLFSLSSNEQKKGLSSQEELQEIIFKSLYLHGITVHNIQQYKDRNNILHLKVDFPYSKYSLLEHKLEEKLKEENSSLLKKIEQQAEGKNFYLWEVEAKDGQNLVILFSCAKERSETFERGKAPARGLKRTKVAFIIDDMGYSLEDLKKIISLKKPVTVSILPSSPYAKETALIAHENGLEVMLHLPLESVNSKNNKNRGGYILSGMSTEEIQRTLEESLQIPYIKGVNNHQGSKITTDETLMRIILEPLKKRNLYFIDSLTTSSSIAFRLAQEMGIRSARRYIFLDSTVNEEYIERMMEDLFVKAQQRNNMVVICHPFQETMQVLKEKVHSVEENNLELVFASQIVR
ncbi:MAG: hypothetical protein GTO17_04800 [Candidatus Aminicenantes bacterium]|nr:hypothetical protein [Candidatus Aminicenantes bacterium]